MANANLTLKLQTIVNLASTHADLLPLAGVGKFYAEPALSLCNDVIQELLAYPHAWKINRADMPPFATAPNKQDYIVSGATAFVLGDGSTGVGIAASGVVKSGTTVTVTTLEAHNMSTGQTVYMLGNADTTFNSTYTQNASSSGYTGGWVITATPTTTTFTFTHGTSGTTTTGPATITDFGWLEGATMRELNSTASIPRPWALEACNFLQPSGLVVRPEKISVLADNGDGTLKIRLKDTPGAQTFLVSPYYQKRAPLKTSLEDNWSPFTDDYSFVYRQCFLARCYRYIDSPRADSEYQKAAQQIVKAMGKADVENSDQHLYPEYSLIDN